MGLVSQKRRLPPGAQLGRGRAYLQAKGQASTAGSQAGAGTCCQQLTRSYPNSRPPLLAITAVMSTYLRQGRDNGTGGWVQLGVGRQSQMHPSAVAQLKAQANSAGARHAPGDSSFVLSRSPSGGSWNQATSHVCFASRLGFCPRRL